MKIGKPILLRFSLKDIEETYMKLIRPLELINNFPIIVLVSHNNRFISWAIRWFTKGSYNHVCWLIARGVVASQDRYYAKRLLVLYMQPGYKLKFYGLKGLSDTQREALMNHIEDKLNKPKIKRRYDYLGIIGQFLKLRFINNPYINFCSESVNEDLKTVYANLPYKPSPAKLNEYFKANPDDFEYLGHFIQEH